MNKSTGIILLLAGGVGAFLVYLYDAYKRMVWRVVYGELVNLNKESVFLNVYFQVYNPTFISFDFGNLDARILINGEQVGKINYPINRKMFKKSVNQITIQVQINFKDLKQEAYNQILRGSLTDWIITIDGKLEVNTKQLDFNKDFLLKDFK